MKLRVDQELHCSAISYIHLPIKDWSEVKSWYVRWDTLHYLLKGEDVWREIGLNSGGPDCIDWSRPLSAEVYDVSANDECEDCLDKIKT